jgi:hypothetical protein
MRAMNFPGRRWLRQARAAWRSSENGSNDPCPTVADIPMGVRSIRTKVIRQAKHK